MKARLFTSILLAATMLFATVVTGQEAKEGKDVLKNDTLSRNILGEVTIDSADDYKQFVKEAEISIAENRNTLDSIRSYLNNITDIPKEGYNSRILALEKRINALQKRIRESGHTGKVRWENFKSRFNEDIENLREDIRAV